MTPTCVELFAGAGGTSLGLRAAGFRSVTQVEWVPEACATLRAAGFTDVVEGDVRKVPFTGLGPVDLLWASPPCQAWSNLGSKKGTGDDRNGWPWTWEAVDRMKAAGSAPTWVVCENVLGLIQHGCAQGAPPDPEGCRGCYWEHVAVAEFAKRYAHVSWDVLDAANYGVPQHRKRVFLVAGPVPFPWPAPSHSQRALAHAKWVTGSYWRERGLERGDANPSAEEARHLGVGVLSTPATERPWVTIRDALGLTKAIRVEIASAVARTVDDVSPTVSGGGTIYTNPRPGEVCRKETRIRPMRAKAVAEAAAKAEEEGDWMDLLEALGSTVVGDPEPDHRRRLSYQELAVLQSFPADHPFQGDQSARYKQVGNAVPPPLAEAIGRAIAATLEPRE